MGKNGSFGTPFSSDDLARVMGQQIVGGKDQAQTSIFELRCEYCNRYLVSAGGSNDQIFVLVKSGEVVLACKNCVSRFVSQGFKVFSPFDADLNANPIVELCRKIPNVKCLGSGNREGLSPSRDRRRKPGYARKSPAHLRELQVGQ